MSVIDLDIERQAHKSVGFLSLSIPNTHQIGNFYQNCYWCYLLT